ncbi:hypothetical protein B0H16DRAFT_1595779 [Mycena metata]|uniref:Uncharacterized protein n=1 Tax=Mycena metata TaxID=1033252 RepID=A0AAD7HQ22_9AGAR|nr:hypothetical protein B0H16DRAFT_1595779 [Mycena metata]
MKYIQKNPHVRPYIQSLSVDLREATMNNCQPIIQFIRTLRVLPTLRSLTILGVHSRMADIFTTSLEDFSFPSVSRLTLDDYLAPIIPCFPNIQILSNTYGSGSGGWLLRTAGPCCKQLYEIHDINFNMDPLTRVLDDAPNLGSLSVQHVLCGESNRMPGKLSRLFVHCYLEGSTATDGDIGGRSGNSFCKPQKEVLVRRNSAFIISRHSKNPITLTSRYLPLNYYSRWPIRTGSGPPLSIIFLFNCPITN